MPHNWLKIDANTPEPWDSLDKPGGYRAEVIRRLEKHPVALVALYWDATKPIAYVLVEGPDNPKALRALAADLPTIDVIQLLADHELVAFTEDEETPAD